MDVDLPDFAEQDRNIDNEEENYDDEGPHNISMDMPIDVDLPGINCSDFSNDDGENTENNSVSNGFADLGN